MNRAASQDEEQRGTGGSPAKADWLPPVDIAETQAAFLITVELCGIPRDEIRVDLERGRLTVSGVRTADVEGETVQYRERPMGRFVRLFSFRTPVDEDSIEAKLADGVLSLRIPKKLSTRAALV